MKHWKRGLACSLFALSLIGNTAYGADGPLPPGKPAGIKKADDETNEAWWMAGILTVTLAVCTYVIFHDKGSDTTTAASGTTG